MQIYLLLFTLLFTQLFTLPGTELKMSAAADQKPVTRQRDYSSGPLYQTIGYGQGKKATTIRGEQGHYVTLVTDEPYIMRSRRSSHTPRARKGARPMHVSTLTIPVQDYTDYNSTNVRVCKST